ncbi:hypothetical protein KHQ81_00005 [Mycoplasmatota bacterium]|nr:hypothetical protein KHQ81_00005 [Mycoplasmatota bacterium]
MFNFFKEKFNKHIRKITDENKEMILNIIFNESLEWGRKRMRPINELTIKKFPKLNSNDITKISKYIESARNDIFGQIEKNYLINLNNLKEIETYIKKEAEFHIKNNYPWMNSENIKRVINQGFYYAWHG